MRRLDFRIFLGGVLLLLTGALAIGQGQEEGNPLGVLPTPPQPNGLWIKLELPDGRSAFAVGEQIRLSFTINQPAYVYIFNIPPTLQVLNIFPNQYTSLQNPLPAGTYLLPDNDLYHLEVVETGGLGLEYFGAIASLDPISEFEARERVLGAILSGSAQEFQGETASAVQGVAPTPNQDALRRVHITVITIQTFPSRRQVPPQGRLFVKSEPPARLIVDGIDFGYTLTDEFRQVPVAAGQHELILKREGYQDFIQSITVGPEEERLFDVQLNRLPAPAFTFSPAAPRVGDAVLFSAVESEDLDGSIALYEWDFDGDGQTDATGYMASRAFIAPGDHLVTLTVTDDKGAKNSLTKAISVQRR